MEDKDITIGRRITELREILNLNKSQFSELTGISRSQLTGYESGSNMPGYESIKGTIEAIPNLNLNWLYTGTEPKFIDNQSPALKNPRMIKILKDQIKNLEGLNAAKQAENEELLKQIESLEKKITVLQKQHTNKS